MTIMTRNQNCEREGKQSLGLGDNEHEMRREMNGNGTA